jgi:hypothetical protein
MSSITLAPDASGTAIFTVAAPNSSTNRTLTLPDATGTLVGDSATQTLTNKTLTAPTISGNLGDGSAGYGTAGQVLISGGAGANTSWASSQSIGVGQSWQDFTGSRTASTSYQNLTGRPIMIAVNTNNNTSPIQVSTNNSTWVTVGTSGGSVQGTVTAIVPPSHYYRINGAGTILNWSELR